MASSPSDSGEADGDGIDHGRDLDSTTTELTGPLPRLDRATQHALRALLVAGRHRDADARAHFRDSRDHDRRVRHAERDPLAQRLGGGAVGHVAAHEHEPILVDVRHHVARAGQGAETLRDRLDELDPGPSAEAVVDRRQVVDLHRHDRDATHVDVAFGEPHPEPVEVEDGDTRRVAVGPVSAAPVTTDLLVRGRIARRLAGHQHGGHFDRLEELADEGGGASRAASGADRGDGRDDGDHQRRNNGPEEQRVHRPSVVALPARLEGRSGHRATIGSMPSRPGEFQAVLFDFYGTLARDVAPFHIDAVMSEHGYELPDHLREIWWSGDIDGIEHGDESRSREDYIAWQQVRLLGMLAEADVHPGEYEVILAKLHAGRAARVLEPYPEAAGVLAALRSRGLQLAVCSNWDWDLEPAVAEAGFGAAVDVLVSSAWAGAQAAPTDLPRRSSSSTSARKTRSSSATRGGPMWKARARSASRRCTSSGTATGPTPRRRRRPPSTRVRWRGRATSWVCSNCCNDMRRRAPRGVGAQITRTFWASSPFRPGPTSNSTACPSSRLR